MSRLRLPNLAFARSAIAPTEPPTPVQVVRPDGRFHDVDNLYCCDSSTFPTGGGWNPTITLIAVSLRIAHGIAGTQPA